MFYLLKMAWRNLGRQRGRTVLSLLAVLFGVLVVVLSKGFVDGSIDSMLNLNINLNSGHLRIIRPEYTIKERFLSLSYPVGEEGKTYPELIKGLRDLPGVETAMGRIRFGLMLVAGEENEPVLGLGVEPGAEDRIAHLSRFLRDYGAGRFPEPGRQEILLGASLMKKLHLKVGDKINGVFSTSFGSFNIATFRVVGKMASGLKFLDEGVAYLPLDQAMKLLELDHAVTEILVFGKNVNETKKLQTVVGKYLSGEKPSLKMIPWNQFSEMIIYLDKFRAVYTFIYIFLVLLSSFVVFNTLMMVISERTKEIGMLTALGMTPRAIKGLFLWEGTIIAVLGSLAGTVTGGVFNWLMSRNGIDLSVAMEMVTKDFLMMPRLYPTYNLSTLIFSFGLGVLVTVVATYLPARRAARLSPTEALRTI